MRKDKKKLTNISKFGQIFVAENEFILMGTSL
jgi:hypothetical protein